MTNRVSATLRGWSAGAALAGCLLATPLVAQTGADAKVELPGPSGPRHHLSAPMYAAEIVELRNLAAACKDRADACDPARVGGDAVVDQAGGEFSVRYDWLRDALEEAKKEKAAERAELMIKVSQRLDGDATELGSGAAESVPLAQARAKADAILNRAEFRQVNQQNLWAKALGLLGQKIDDVIRRMSQHMPHAPGLMLAVEWGLLCLAAAGLLLWAWRTTRQQRLAVTAPAEANQAFWQKESDDWARRAEAQAAAGEWREAVHCLYWAAIVMLEGRRMWRANRARTPREYLPLLQAGSARQRALGGLTRSFERIWYGLRPASRTDFERAQALLEELKVV